MARLLVALSAIIAIIGLCAGVLYVGIPDSPNKVLIVTGIIVGIVVAALLCFIVENKVIQYLQRKNKNHMRHETVLKLP